MKNKPIPGIYNLKQFCVATMLGGPFIAGSVIAFNIWAQKQRLKPCLAFILGILLEIVWILFAYTLAVHWLDLPNKMKIWAGLSVLIILNCILAFYSRFFFKRKVKLNEFLFPVINQELHHERKSYPLFIISVLSFFTVLAIPPFYFPVLLLYLFPHFYGYIVISKVFFNSKIVKYINVLIVLLACCLPLVFTIHWLLRKQTLFSEYAFYYLVIYSVTLLYILLIIGSFEILKLLNKLFKLISFEKLQSKPIVLGSILFSVIVASAFTSYGYYNNDHPVINKYSITLAQKTSKLDSLKVICVADIHLKNLTNNSFLDKLIGKIKEAQPDLLVLSGDLIEAYNNIIKEEKLKKFQELFKGIKPLYGIYSSPGNHDDFAMGQFYKNTNIICLSDSVMEIKDKILLVGLKYRGNHEIWPLDSLLKYNSKKLPVILLDHAPYCLDYSVKNNIDIQFSGHTHNGQLWPFNYIAEAVYDIAWGYKKIKNTHVFVTCGVQDGFLPAYQNISIPIKTGSISEIMEVNIKFK